MNKIPGLKIIGLTGPSGAGKGIVASIFAKRGFPSVDTDAVYHDLLIPPSACLDQLCRTFGPSVLSADGTLNRSALSAIVFEPTEEGKRALQKLNEITHKAILEKSQTILEEYAAAGHCYALLDAPLLIEAGLCGICERVIVVLADRATRTHRLMLRDHKTREEIEKRLDAQPKPAFYTARADDILYNNGNIEELESTVDRILSKLQKN